MPPLIKFIMVSLNIGIICIANHLQTFFLTMIGVKDTTKLSYKVLRYFPLFVVSNLNLMTNNCLVIGTKLKHAVSIRGPR